MRLKEPVAGRTDILYSCLSIFIWFARATAASVIVHALLKQVMKFMNAASAVLTPWEIRLWYTSGERRWTGEFVNNENSIRVAARSSPRNFSFRAKCSANARNLANPRVYPAGNSKFKLFLRFFSYPQGYRSVPFLPSPLPLSFFFLSLSRVCIFHDASEYTVESLARNLTGSFIRGRGNRGKGNAFPCVAEVFPDCTKQIA